MDSFDEILRKKCETEMSAASFVSEDLPPITEEILPCVVTAEGRFLNLQLLGAIANGGAILPLKDSVGRTTKALKFTIVGQPFKINGRPAHYLNVQILDAGIGKEIQAQSYRRTKKVIVKKEVLKKPTVKKKELVVDDKVVQKSIFDV